jgi:arylsulfatase A-like enzyme
VSALRPPIAVALLALLAAACGGAAERGPLRLTELAAASGGEAPPVQLARDLEVGAEPVTLTVDLPASRMARLRLAASGDADLVKLSWRLASEKRFRAFRSLSFPLSPDGAEHVYHVDLRREPYWTGSIGSLRLSTADGRVRVVEMTGLEDRSPRVTSLSGATRPTLPGARRITLALPDDGPRTATFEVHLGLLPRFENPAVTARFRAWAEGPGGERRPWLDEQVAGGGDPRWRPVRRRVRVPAGGRVVLDATAAWQGRPLPEGSAVWGSPMLHSRGAAPAGPHLVVVVVDTLRADVLGAYGGPAGLTPRLDALARRATRLDDLMAPAPWTLPSVATLLTGFPPGVHGAGRRLGGFAPTGLGDAPTTLAEVLAAHGFRTTAVYNNIYLNPSFGMERGFDEYAWYEANDDVLVDRALERLAAFRDGDRHFLLLHLFGPHHPYWPPDPTCRKVARRFAPDYRGALGCRAFRSDVPTMGQPPPPEADRPWVEALYRAEVAFTDRQLGRLFDGLAAHGLDEDTVLLVVSDHGEAFWDRLPALAARGYEQSDHGHTHYQELMRVPGLVWAPGRRPAVLASPAAMEDLFPTLLHLLGVEAPPVSGHDLVPRLDGGPAERRTLLADFLLYGPARWAVRRGHWKLVVPADDASLPLELYDLAADPGELADLATARPEVVSALRALGERERREAERLRRHLLAGDDDVLESAYLEWNHITKLRSLGYLK